MKKNRSWKVKSSIGVMGSSNPTGDTSRLRVMGGASSAENVQPRVEVAEAPLARGLQGLVDDRVVGRLVAAQDDDGRDLAVLVLGGLGGPLAEPVVVVTDAHRLLAEHQDLPLGVDVDEEDVAL